MTQQQYAVGDIVQMKKKHACGHDQWEIKRTGMDFRLQCLRCLRQIWLSRVSFEKAVRRIIKRSSC